MARGASTEMEMKLSPKDVLEDDSQWYGELLGIPDILFLLASLVCCPLLKIPTHQYEALKKAKWHGSPDELPKTLDGVFIF